MRFRVEMDGEYRIEMDGDKIDVISEFCEYDRPMLVRAAVAWRRPVFHIAIRYVDTLTDDHHLEGRWVAPMCPNNGPFLNPTVVESLPDGCEICQRCAERMTYEFMRDSERSAPNRPAYNDWTNKLLQRSGVRIG